MVLGRFTLIDVFTRDFFTRRAENSSTLRLTYCSQIS
jgi:hypothetical protein